jgi:hypothetical protein
MNRIDYFLNYNEEDLRYELNMLIFFRRGIGTFSDPFLNYLCLEGLLLHARRIIEVFWLDVLDKKWDKRWGLISEHLSHAKPSNRSDQRSTKRENPEWDVEGYYYELIDAMETVADQHKSEYAHYDLLISILKSARNVGGKGTLCQATTTDWQDNR